MYPQNCKVSNPNHSPTELFTTNLDYMQCFHFSGPEQVFAQSPPTKLPRDASIIHEHTSLLPGDETDYKSPPISRPSSNQEIFFSFRNDKI